MSASKHVHQWTVVYHADSCHGYEWAYTCACGAARLDYAERNLKDDPYSAIWMMDDEGDEPKCERCAELMAGAEPKHESTVSDDAPSEAQGGRA